MGKLAREAITRPALCLERLSTNAAGPVVYELKNPFRVGTTHVLFSPQAFIARTAALVPRPRVNLTGTPADTQNVTPNPTVAKCIKANV